MITAIAEVNWASRQKMENMKESRTLQEADKQEKSTLEHQKRWQQVASRSRCKDSHTRHFIYLCIHFYDVQRMAVDCLSCYEFHFPTKRTMNLCKRTPEFLEYNQNRDVCSLALPGDPELLWHLLAGIDSCSKDICNKILACTRADCVCAGPWEAQFVT